MDAHVRPVQQPRQGRLRLGQAAPDFYEEYLAVMDLTAEFYLQTIETVFQEHALPEGHDDAPRRAGRLRGDPATPR